MIKQVLEEFLRWLGFGIFIDPINGAIEWFLAPMFRRLAEHSGSAASWGSFEGLIGLGFTFGTMVITFIAIITVLETRTIGGTLSWLMNAIAGYKMTYWVRMGIATLTIGVGWLLGRLGVIGYRPIETAVRIRDSANGMIDVLLSTQPVPMEEVLWGITSHPVAEMTFLVLIAIGALTAASARTTYLPPTWVGVGSTGLVLVTVTFANVLGDGIFPIQERWAFIFTFLVSLAFITILVMALGYATWKILRGTPRFEAGDPPSGQYAITDALILMVLIGAYGSTFSGLIGFAFWRIWRIGGPATIRSRFTSPHESSSSEPIEPPTEIEVTNNE